MSHPEEQPYTVTVADAQGTCEEHNLQATTALKALQHAHNLVARRVSPTEPAARNGRTTPRHCEFWKCGKFVADSVGETHIRYWDGQILEILLCPRCANRAVGMPPMEQ